MAEEKQGENQNQGQEQQQTQSGQPPKTSVVPAILLAAIPLAQPILIFVIALAIVFAFLSTKMGDPARDTTGLNGNVNCKDWSSAPAEAQQIITDAANEFKVHPALVGAIHLQENGGTFKPVNANYAAYSGGNGPFQFIKSTWENVIMKAFRAFTKADVMDYRKSARGAAYYTSQLYTGALKITGEPAGSTSDRVIRCAALGYNRGGAAEETFCGKDGSEEKLLQFIRNHPDTYKNDSTGKKTPEWYKDVAMAYMDGVSKYFSNLNQGCSQYAGIGMGGSVVQIAQSQLGTTGLGDLVKYNPNPNSPLKWCASFVSWCFKQAGYKFEFSTSVLKLQNDCISAKTFNDNPTIGELQPGDIVFYRAYSHTGIVEAIKGNSVQTIEGNTSRDRVARQKRSASEFVGSCRPNPPAGKPKISVPKDPPKTDDREWIIDADSGMRIPKIQLSNP